MPTKIPWEIIGPAAGVVIILLVIIFKFMLKWQKQAKDKTIQVTPNPPKSLNSMNKKSICMQHEGRISSNETAVTMIADQLKTSNKDNSDAHGKLFDKLEDLGKEIITEIHKK